MFEEQNATCANDGDCPNGQLCYMAETAWLDGVADLAWRDPSKNVCLCSTWYGWKGDSCSEKTVQFYFAMVLESLEAILSLVAFLVCCYTLFCIASDAPSEKNKSRAAYFFTTFNLCTVLTAIGSFGLFLSRVAILQTFSGDPDNINDWSDSDIGTDDKLVKSSILFLERIGYVLCCTAAVLAAFSLALSWIELSSSTNNMRSWASQKTLNIYKKVNIGFMSLYTTTLLGLIITNNMFYSILAAAPFLLFVGVSFAVGSFKMTKVLGRAASFNQAGSSASQAGSSASQAYYNDLLRLIRNVAMSISFSVFLMVLGSVVSFYLSQASEWKELCPIDGICTSYIGLQILLVGMTSGICVLTYYPFTVVKKRRAFMRQNSSAGTLSFAKDSGLSDNATSERNSPSSSQARETSLQWSKAAVPPETIASTIGPEEP